MSEKRERRSHEPAFKERAVKMALDSGNKSKTAKDLGIQYQLLLSWIKQAEMARAIGMGLQAALEDKAELERLSKENASLREDVEILKKAAVFFATDKLKKSTPGLKS
jgi:transposase